MKRTIMLSACLLVLAAAWGGAQTTLTHAAAGTTPKTDGTVNAKEYAVTTGDANLQLSLSWIGDTLYLGIVGQTTGWVAAGIGSTAMNNAVMYMGFITGDQTQMKVQVGAGHRHSDTDTNVPLLYAMTESAGKTTLEVAVKAAGFIVAGQKKLDVILAMGNADSFLSMHKAKSIASIALAQ
jgi:DOMON domain